MYERLIEADRSVVVALDAETPRRNLDVVCAVERISGVSGFKVGFGLALHGLAQQTSLIRSVWSQRRATIVYDHQKGGTDIPETGALYARTVKAAGVDAAILFPLTGPVSQEEWTKACIGEGLRPIIGLAMTHPRFLVSEGGYVADDAPERAFRLACRQGVRDFVVPGTKIHWVKTLRGILTEELGEDGFVLYAPGFVTQGGDISECGQAAGKRFHPIVGSAIYKRNTRDEMTAAASLAASKLAA